MERLLIRGACNEQRTSADVEGHGKAIMRRMVLSGEYIESRVERIPEAGCWIWLRHILNNGYGAIWILDEKFTAHRISYQIYKGPIPAGLMVLHRCDVRCCVNPSHLWLGTAKDNTQDMLAKGRTRPRRGERAPQSKLNDRLVLEIRTSDKPMRQWARELGIDSGTICNARNGISWRHLPMDKQIALRRLDALLK